MKAKHSVWKNKLVKTLSLTTVILVAALFLGTAATAGLTPQTTPTLKNENNIPIAAKTQLSPTSKTTRNAHDVVQLGQPEFHPSAPLGEVIFSQGYYLPTEAWNFYTSDLGLGYLVQEDFFEVASDIGDIEWYGLDFNWNTYVPGNPTGMTFNIIFYEDSGGAPGAEVANFANIEPTFVDTGLAYSSWGDMWYWQFDLPSIVSLSAGWVGIQSTYCPDGSMFLWATGPDGNLNGRQNGGNVGANFAYSLTAPNVVYDHDIAISTIMAPVSGGAAPITPIVKVKNAGLNTETNVNVQFAIGKETVSGTLENFEATDGGYIHYPKLPQPDVWAWGAPTSGPMAAYSGSNVWATNLAGAYPPSMWCILQSTPFVVPSGAMFNFWQWYYFEANYDGGNVKISNDGGITYTIITPVGGYPGTMPNNPFMTGQPAFNGQSGGWKQANFDLSAYEGQTCQIIFETASDTSLQYDGWYIDDVGFTSVSWANEYTQIATIGSILPGEIVNLSFPTWTPADLGLVENTHINYNSEVTNLFVDENPNNDYKQKAFTLTYGYFDDVAVTQIVSPVSGLAETQTPVVAIANHGQNAESVNVNMNIGKALYTTLLEEDFAGGVPPAGWTTDAPIHWMGSSTNYAGGTAPEAEFYYANSDVGDFHLYTGVIDTTGFTAIGLKFKEMVNDYNGDYTLKVQTSTDGGVTWSDAYVRAGGPYGPATTEVTLTAANGVGSPTLQISWTYSGNAFNINYWYIDDVWMGIIDMVDEYDQTVTVDIAAGASMNVTLPDWTPSDIPFANSIDYLVNVEATLNGFSPIWNYGFEDWVAAVPPGPVVFPPAGWTVINANGDGVTWTQYTPGYTGSYCASIGYHYPTDDDWLTTQPVMVPGGGGMFSFYWKVGSTYYAEHFKIYYSTSGNTVADFTGPNGYVIGDITYNADTNWHQFTYYMSSPEQVWFAVYIDSADALRLSVDDFAFPDGTTQGFDEGTPGVPGHWPGWDIINYGVPDQWFGVTSGLYPTCSPPEGTTMAEYNSWNIVAGNAADLLKTGAPVDFTSAHTMKFQMNHNTGYNAADVIYPLLSADGVNWWYDGTGFYQYDGTNGWKTETFDYSGLITYLGGPGYYYIGFEALSDYGYNMFIDDLSVSIASEIPDGFPADNTLGAIITLSYEHDVGVTAITQPSGSAPAKDDAWLQYDNGVYNVAFGSTTGHIYTSNRFTPDEIGGYVGWSLDTIMFKHYGAESFTGTVRIYDAGSATAPGAMLTSEPFSITGAGWFNVTLSNPITITGGDIWLGAEGTHATGQYPFECSAPGITGKTAFFSSDDAVWYDLTTLGYNVAWELRGHVVSGGGGGGENWLPGTYPVEGIIQNLGVTYPEIDIPVNAQITNDTGVVVYDETVIVAGPLAPGAGAIATFPTITIPSEPSAEGDYKLTMKTVLPGDDHPNNDKKTLTWIIQIPDTTPPVTTATVSGTMGQNDWYVSNVQVTLTAVDFKWPLGVNHTYYKIDTGAWNEYTVPIVVDTDGQHTVYFYSDDKAIPPNVEEEQSVSFKIDKTAPVINSYTATAQNFMKTKWLLVADATDPMSGIVLVEFYTDDALAGSVTTTPYEFTVHGKIHTTQCIVYDAAGNSKLSDVVVSYEVGSQQQSLNGMQIFQQKLI